MLWKLLYYDDSDAWSKNNLTIQEKSSLIYKGEQDSSNFRVFQTAITNDIWNKQQSILRVYEVVTSPINFTVSVINFEIDALCNAKVDQLSNYQTRSLRMQQEILATLNGVDIGAVSLLEFNRDGDGCSRDRAMLNQLNDKGWVGYSMVLHTRLGQ